MPPHRFPTCRADMSNFDAGRQPMRSPDAIARMSERLDQTDERIRGIAARLDEHLDRLDRGNELRKQLDGMVSACRDASRPRLRRPADSAR
jgi:hypothetical protein